MSDYPKYFPPFLQDHHNMKDVCKAFFVWLHMMDNRQEQNGTEFNSYHKRRENMTNWMDFHVLLASFIDFMNLCGYRIYKARGQEQVEGGDFRDMARLPIVWESITHPDQPLTYKDEHIKEQMKKFIAYFEFMPEDVKAAWLKGLGGGENE